MPLPPLRWAVLHVDLEPVMGHEQGGRRRVLVVSYEPFHRSRCLTVCPITSARTDTRYPHEVQIPVGEAGQTKPGVILCHQVRTVSMDRTAELASGYRSRILYVTSRSIRRNVRAALAGHFALDVPPLQDGAT